MIMTMAYLLLVAVLICVAALLGERLCAELGWPRRSAWLLALVASVALPAYTMFFDAAGTSGSPIFSLPLVLDVLPAINNGGIETVAAEAATKTSFSWPDWQVFNSAFVVVWAISSTAMLLFFSLASLRLRRILRNSQAMSIGDQKILLSDSLGPAVLGFVRPRIVLPRWLAEKETTLRSLVVSHEREHIDAKDHMTLFAALLLVALMPWNIALWWQLRRLRAAMEVDCDNRVLRNGVDAHDYSEALLTVGQQSVRTPFGSVALTEPVSELETRIGIMLDKARNFSLASFGARSVLAVAVLSLAIAVNAPNAQQPTDGDEASDSGKTIPTVRTAIFDRLSEAQACMEAEDTPCAMRILDAVAEQRDLNVYETAQLQNFYAFVHFDQDDHDGAAKAYENILALPRSDLPNGLIQSSMRNLATLYLQEEKWNEGLELYDRWMALPSVTPKPSDYYLKATILYQMERYEDALVPMKQAIAESEEPIENYYQMLFVLNHQTDNEEGVFSALETLNERWPKETWVKALEVAQQRQGAAAEAAASTTSDSIGQAQPESANLSREYLPIFSAAPIYPPPAAARGIEGYVVARYTVATDGSTKDIEIVESTDPIFENASIESVEKYRYRPRVIDNARVEVAGVTTRIVFELGEDIE